MPTPADELERTLWTAPGALLSIADAVAGEPLAPGKWSRKQMLGHLIDSASNNHQRFVRVQVAMNDQGGAGGAGGAGLVLPGYEQDAWVDVQGYQQARWTNLVRLWQHYNVHLIHVMRRIPASALERSCTVGGASVTLDFVVRDYVIHLKHHLEQILR